MTRSLPADDDDDDDDVRRLGCDRWPLHYACRVGNLRQVQYLVQVLQVNVDEADAHDATPLYLAALTGRHEICRFLLEHGATCDPRGGGDAARVFYVALTDDLRRLLREWSLTAASRDVFLDLLGQQFNNPHAYPDTLYVIPAAHSDAMAPTAGRPRHIYLHRALLVARCPALRAWIVPRPKTSHGDEGDDYAYSLQVPVTDLPSLQQQYPTLLPQFLESLYTGVWEMRAQADVVGLAQGALVLVSLLGLARVERPLRAALDQHATRSSSGCNRSTEFCCHLMDAPGVKEDCLAWARRVSTPRNLLVEVDDGSDLVLTCHEASYALHKVMLCPQSEYFRCALGGNFREGREGRLDLTHLVPQREALEWTIQWFYANAFCMGTKDDDKDGDSRRVPSLEVALEICDLAQALLCPRLTAYVANTVLVPAVELTNVFDLLSLAQHHTLERLEDTCVAVLAADLDALWGYYREDFCTVLSLEAAATRQDDGVADLPVVAEMKRAIRESEREVDKRLDALQIMVDEVLQREVMERKVRITICCVRRPAISLPRSRDVSR
jgi:hypothetical protein